MNKTTIFGFFLILIMMFSALQTPHLVETENTVNAGARDTLEVDCSNYSFEELFVYDFATYDLEMSTDWQTGWLTASAYVNGSNGAQVRTDLDELLDGAPGGNNTWISTDEREAVRQVGPDCISDMVTKMGMREGIVHRGLADWNDFEWVKEGIKLDENDLVPEGHAEERTCQNAWATPDCKEVPVSITDDLQIHLLKDTEGSDNNIELNQLSNKGNSNFTFSMNTTNVTSAKISLNFPPVNGLRIANWDVYRDGHEHTENVTESPQATYNSDGSLTVTYESTYNLADWPIVQELFIDFTTEPLDNDEAPNWSTTAPENGTVIPIVNDGSEVTMLSFSQVSEFLVDEGLVSLDCSGPSGWSLQTVSSGDVMVTPGSDSGEVSCTGVDAYEKVSSVRTWTVAQPVVLTAEGDYLDSAPITVTPTSYVSNPTITLTGLQGERSTASVMKSDLSTQTSLDLSLSGLSPGAFTIQVVATASGMLDWQAELDLGLSKTNQPPTVSVQKTLNGENGTWDEYGNSYSMSGTFYEPDGQEVEFSIEVCGYSTSSVNQMGANWDATVSVAGCMFADLPQEMKIIVTDASGASSNKTVYAIPPGFDAGDSGGNGGSDSVVETTEDSSLPAPGIAFALIGIALAAIVSRKRN